MTRADQSVDNIAAPPRWSMLLLTLVALALATVVWVAPDAVAGRLTVTALPEGASLDYARTLLRNLAMTSSAAMLVLVAWWGWSGRVRAVSLGRWCLVASMGLYFAAAASMWWYVDDDAGISFTYARNLAEGRGLVYNPGDAPVEGYSNPLWVLILAGARLTHFDIIWTAKVLGLSFGSLCLVLMWRAFRDQHPAAWLALPLAALNASAVVWTSSGLENALHAFLLTAIIVLVPAAEKRSQVSWLLVIVLAALVLSRPEGFMFAVAVAAFLAVRARLRGDSLKPVLVTIGVPLIVLVGLLIFREVYFGYLLPNTFYAKASSSNPLRLLNPGSGGWQYLAEGVSGCGWTMGLLPMLVAIALPRKWGATVAIAALVVGAQIFFVVSVGGDWMKEFRFLAPVAPAVSILIGIGLGRVCELAGSLGRRAAAASAVLVALVIYPQVHRLIAFAYAPTTPLQTVAAIGDYFKALGHEAGIEDPTLLHHDAGGTSFIARIHLIDLAGLCDPVIAHHWRDRERIRKYIFEEQKPDFIYSGPHFARRIGLEQFPEFQSDYVALPPPPTPVLDGYIRRVRRDLYPKLFGEMPTSAG